MYKTGVGKSKLLRKNIVKQHVAKYSKNHITSAIEAVVADVVVMLHAVCLL